CRHLLSPLHLTPSSFTATYAVISIIPTLTFCRSAPLLDLHSFPTRRSSDLHQLEVRTGNVNVGAGRRFVDLDTMRNLLFHRVHVRHQSDKPAVVLQRIQHTHYIIESLGI